MVRRVLIEGWRGIGHSYSLVNQNQILALLERPEVELHHHDVAFYGTNWSRAATPAGFDKEQQSRIDAVPGLGAVRPDTIYRISFPPRAYGGDAEKIYCFNTAEYVAKPAFYSGPETAARHANETVTIVTPSNWSRQAFLQAGLKPERVIVVPHGIDPQTYRPLTGAEREGLRRNLGFPADCFVFLNVSAMTHNKGIEDLLEAFGIVLERHGNCRLVLKDMGALYMTRASKVMAAWRQSNPALADRVARNCTILSQSVPQRMLRQLYAACDAYVSPYRAEGFNLPPLEAAACGTPVIVTAGGPTDDYYDPLLGWQIASRPALDPKFGRCVAPQRDSLIACMMAAIGKRETSDDRARRAAHVHARHAWARVADRLVALF